MPVRLRRACSRACFGLVLAAGLSVSAGAGVDSQTKGQAEAGQPGQLFCLVGHKKAVSAACVAADVKKGRALSADRGMLVLWDIDAGRELRRFDTGGAEVVSVAISADGRRAVSGEKTGLIRYWNLETGQQLLELEGHRDAVAALALSADGRRAFSASGGVDRTMRRWDLQKGTEVAQSRFPSSRYLIYSMYLSPDGQRALTGLSSKIQLWNVTAAHEIASFEGHAKAVKSVTLSPDGRFVAGGGVDKTIRIWEAAAPKRELRTLEGHKGEVTALAFCPDGRRILSGSADGTVRLWDLVSGKQLHLFDGHEDEVTGVACFGDNLRALSVSKDRTVRVWRLPRPAAKAK